MTNIQWGLLGGPVNVGGMFQQGFQQGTAMRRERETQNALSALVQQPDSPEAINALARWNPQGALQWQGQRADARKQEVAAQQAAAEQHRERVVMGAKIVREINPTDQAGWDRARQTAAQMGVDVSDVPAQFDPAYVKSLVDIANVAAPPKAESSGWSVQSIQPGGGLYRANRETGAIETLVAPNDGSHAMGTPVGAPAPAGVTFTPIDDGGPTPPASGNFPR